MSIFGNTLELGKLAPNFTLEDQDGNRRMLNDYRGKKVVIYFFPKADTPGWRKQACGLRDNFENYEKLNIEILGISYDSKATLKKFREKYPWLRTETGGALNNKLRIYLPNDYGGTQELDLKNSYKKQDNIDLLENIKEIDQQIAHGKISKLTFLLSSHNIFEKIDCDLFLLNRSYY